MKFRLSRPLEPWPETEYFQRLRDRGIRPEKHATFELIEKNGQCLEGVSGEHEFMPSHFRHDVRSEDDFQTLLQALENVAGGRIAEFEWTGNAWTAMLRREGVTFEYSIMDGETGGRVSLETYRFALEAWRDFLADESCDERIIDLAD